MPHTDAKTIMLIETLAKMETSRAVLSFINAVLADAGREPVNSITSQRHIIRDDAEDCRLDVKGKIDGQPAMFQIRQSNGPDSVHHAFADGFAVLHQEIMAAQTYQDVPTITIINLFDGPSPRPAHPYYHQPIQLTYMDDPKETASNRLTVHILETGKFDETNFDVGNALARWMYYLKTGWRLPRAPLTREVLSMDAGLRLFADAQNPGQRSRRTHAAQPPAKRKPSHDQSRGR